MNKMRILIKGIEIIKRKQMVILELNSTRTEMKKKNLEDRFTSDLNRQKNNH